MFVLLFEAAFEIIMINPYFKTSIGSKFDLYLNMLKLNLRQSTGLILYHSVVYIFRPVWSLSPFWEFLEIYMRITDEANRPKLAKRAQNIWQSLQLFSRFLGLFIAHKLYSFYNLLFKV